MSEERLPTTALPAAADSPPAVDGNNEASHVSGPHDLGLDGKSDGEGSGEEEDSDNEDDEDDPYSLIGGLSLDTADDVALEMDVDIDY